MITKFNIFLNENYEEPTSKKDAADSLSSDYKYKTDNHGRLNRTFSNNIIVYHGTTKAIAEKIKKEGFFKDGFFMATTSGVYGDTANKYAKMRADIAGEKGSGEVIKFEVDPRCLLVNGAGELESRGDLYRQENGTWTNKEYIKSEDSITKLETIGIDATKKLLNILSEDDKEHHIGRWIYGFLSMIHNFYYSQGLTRIEQLEAAYRKEIDYNIELMKNNPRKFTNLAKLWKIDKLTFANIINKLDKLEVKNFIKL